MGGSGLLCPPAPPPPCCPSEVREGFCSPPGLSRPKAELPWCLGNVTQRQAQTTQRPQCATGHGWPGASMAHREPILESTRPFLATQGAAPLPDAWCSDSPRAGIPSKAEPPRMASSSLHLLGRVPARARVGLRLQPATVPQQRPWPELSSPLPGGKHQPRPAEVNAGTFWEFLEHDAGRDTGQPSPGIRAGVPRAAVSVGQGRQRSGQVLQTRSGPGGRCAEKLRGLS